ncbi:MAG: hypothetical protein AVDCRST_MAG33-631 [uncultured Thermomicrobiales bacterium]|uniref:Uncharacterized protein n=1 Tax=uncultured Thermomicrobiales bacterium TaxID=1645740 RepID=A0A6J4UGY4_9BACT|nr:MAG: hypothetical protein AVDCRST_MAG33-631 [uncultured Thermomicrobiales bacterium]
MLSSTERTLGRCSRVRSAWGGLVSNSVGIQSWERRDRSISVVAPLMALDRWQVLIMGRMHDLGQRFTSVNRIVGN